jgi:hypothetical protein
MFRILRQFELTAAGGVMVSFNKWRSIPRSQNLEQLAKGAKFERRLLVLVHSNFVAAFSPLKDLYYDALAIKKRAVLLLVKT